MDERTRRITKDCRLDGIGLEIGPSYAPICPKRDGYHVETIDFMTREELIRLNRERRFSEEMIARIEEVDYIWKGGSYAELTGKSNYYDFIIASHLIEHTTDIIDFLNDCSAMLKRDGRVSLVIPDQRYCFDYFRPCSTVGKAIDKHEQKSKVHSAGTVVESQMIAANNGGHIAWNEIMFSAQKQVRLCENEEMIRTWLEQNRGRDDYTDCHEWVFTPSSCRLLFSDLYSLGYTDLVETGFAPTPDDYCEFYITLGFGDGGNRVFDQEKRLALLRAHCRELVSVYGREIMQEACVPKEGSVSAALYEDALAERDAAREAYRSLVNSRTWKMTGLLRRGLDRLKGVRG